MQKGEQGLWICLSCDYTSRNSAHVKHHIESKHLSVEYTCDYCSSTCPTKYALNMHIHRKHKQ